ncbi:LysR family transcriptional regulator [Kluyvera intermedia]|uniref:LysR family transcriptional regulator n=1 Tax=Kluyvera intermedia TaxID=61648 RepID=UPI00242CF82B|nr:LysR family transcriptional regulator [Kluyvera intermedia]WEJ85001.1 MAG: LysR substrate-binding domain-containing protein [Kluyvera intermedia]
MEPLALDRLTGIIAFARAASLGSYTAASRTLAISPSAVSKSIKRLEDRLGVKLFNRTTRSLTLTPEGTELYQKALRLLRDAEEIEQAAFAARNEPSGTLKITAPVPVGLHLLVPNLPRFRAQFPALTVDLRLNDTFTDLIEESIDVAVRIGPLVDSRLIARKLATNIVCCYASPAYIRRHGIPMTPGECREHEIVNVRYQSSGQMMKWMFNVDGEIVEFFPEATLSVNSTDAVLTFILNSGGIGMLPSFIADSFVHKGELVPIMQECWVARNDITAFWPESRRGNPNVRAFMDFLASVFPENTPWNTRFSR